MDSVHNPKKWFLILNKSPRGPFFEHEIKELLQQGLIRHNDLALLFEEGVQGNWKFLWQYPEFDSRLNRKSSPPPEILEKRKPRTNEEIQKELENEVPLDLKSIPLEELIIRAKPRAKREAEVKDSFFRETKSDFKSSPARSWMKLMPLFLFLAAVTGMILTQKTSTQSPNITSPKEPPRIVASEMKPTIPGARKTISPPKKKEVVSMPQERDRGEVREDELLRLRQAERLKELEERARIERSKMVDMIETSSESRGGEGEESKDSELEDEGEGEGQEEELEFESDETDGNGKSKKRKNNRKSKNGQGDSGEEEEPSWWLED